MCLFFYNATATTQIYPYVHTLSFHDALPISSPSSLRPSPSIAMAVVNNAAARARRFLQFCDASPSPFHAVEEAKARLLQAGYTKICEGASWTGKIGRAHV